MEQIFSDVKNMMGKAVKKSGDAFEVAKCKFSIGDTKSEMQVKYAELGKRVYQAHKGEETEDIEELFWDLDELSEILEDLEKKLADLKKQKLCPACGQTCDAGDAFCRACGKPLPEEKQEHAQEAEKNEDEQDESE